MSGRGKKSRNKESKKDSPKEDKAEEVVEEEDESQYESLPVALSLEIEKEDNLEKSIQDVRQENFEFVIAPLSHPGYQKDFVTRVISRSEPLKRSDTLLSTSQLASNVVGIISTEDLDSTDDSIRNKAKKRFLQEVNWATHLALPAIMLRINSYQCVHVAQLLNQVVQSLLYTQIWICVPLSATADQEESKNETKNKKDSWEWWNTVNKQVLEISENLPTKEQCNRWKGEPLKAVIIPTSTFINNNKGYAVLSQRHQEFISSLFKFKIHFIFKGKPAQNTWKHYVRYFQFLYQKYPPFTQEDQMEIPYYDYLQAPLQPLMDNLEAQTYETFERDLPKYRAYQEAVFRALSDRSADREYTLMVLGAGRGPLVKASFIAAQRAKRSIKMFAIEKNPNAIIMLLNMKQSFEWGNKVTIVETDMRDWSPPEKADIIISELLGSFGDNELSPECLDGAQKVLKEDGISIPCSYTSYVAPISSQRLHNEVRSWKDLKHLETAYVVKLHNIYALDKPKPFATFKHPNNEGTIDNSRYKMFEFTSAESSVLHGFAGYFDTVLYKDVTLSIHPDTHTIDMHSWFPLFIPIREPVYVPKGEKIEAHFWRNVSRTKVWYEWTLVSPSVTPIHNVGGRSYWIGL